MKIEIDKNAKIPIYKQIVDQISGLTKRGVYQGGEKLPTERELAAHYGIARGTVKRAYDQLAENGVITVNQGKGSFIWDNATKPEEPKTIALIDQYLDQLQESGLSLDDIERCVAQRLQKLGEQRATLHIAVVERCPECLSGALDCLAAFSGNQLDGYLLGDVLHNPELLLDRYDFIIATDAHSTVLENSIPTLRKILLPISFSISPQTLQEISRLGPQDHPGLFCQTQRYAEMVSEELMRLDESIPLQGIFFSGGKRQLKPFLEGKNVLIAAPSYREFLTAEQQRELDEFLAAGNRLLLFLYRMDTGSAMYLEESIRRFRINHYDLLQQG